MNSNFNDEQIRAYAAAFEEGDAVWCDGKWREVSRPAENSRALTCESSNRYVIRNYDGEVPISGFREEEKPYRVTTLEHYELQGGEKLVWLGGELTMAYTTFGKTYKVISDHHGNVYYRDDNSGLYKAGNDGWAVIPRYEQVKSAPKFKVGDKVTLENHKYPAIVKKVEVSERNGSYIYLLKHRGKIVNFREMESDLELYKQVEKNQKDDDNMDEFKLVEGTECTGKFKAGDKVKVVAVMHGGYDALPKRKIGETGTVSNVDNDGGKYHYCVTFQDTKCWFNEVELAKDSSKTTLTEKVNEVVNDKTNERPASSHYHHDNNGNDVWKFADDNLSEERVKGFHQINAIKYVSRYHKKHDTIEKRIEDLEKAKVSIDKLIELERKG